MFVCPKSVDSVAVSVLSMCVAVLSGEDARATYGARWTCAECVIKHDSAFCESVDVWGSDDIISVALRDPAPIVSDNEHYVFIGIFHDSPLHWNTRVIRLGY